MATSMIRKQTVATTSADGLMSAADKTKLNNTKTLSSKTQTSTTSTTGNASLGLAVSGNVVVAVYCATDSAQMCNITPYQTTSGQWYGHCVDSAGALVNSKSVKMVIWYLH